MRRKLLPFFSLLLLFTSFYNITSAQMRQVYIDTATINNNIKKISFYSHSQGWLAGYDNAATWVAYTTDSGRTLTKKYITGNNVNYNGSDVNLSFGFDIAGVKAFNQNTLIVYGDYGLVPSILYSADGGNSFTLVFHSQYNDLQLSGGITDMVFPENNSIGFAADADRVLKTMDGGQSWLMIKDDPQSFFESIEATDNNTLFVFSKTEGNSKIIKTLNGGTGWQQLPIPYATILSASFITATKGWLNVLDADYNGLMYYTSNGGFDWQLKNNAAINPFANTKMKFINDSTGFALGDLYTVFKTTDSGKVWERLPRDNQFKDAGASHNDLFFINNNQFWAAGYRNFVELNTNTGGITISQALFAIDTTGVAATNLVQLVNYSKPNYQFKWYVNNQFLNSNFNTFYPHNSASGFDSVKLVVTNGTYKDSVTKYQFFTAIPPVPIPKIDSFTPGSNSKDFTVTIFGSNFVGINTVKFGNVYAASFIVVSPNVIKAVVGNGNSGPVSVSNNNGMATKSGFVYTTRLKITSFTPIRGPVGSTVFVSGTNFNNTPADNIVYFGTVKAVVLSASSTQLAVKVPAGISYIPISVTVNKSTVFSNLPFTVTFSVDCSFSANSFAPRVDSSTDYRPIDIACGDLDGDGKPDLVTGSQNVNRLSYHLNTSNAGSISFDAKQLLPIAVSGYGIGQFCINDMDGDGKLDICTTTDTYGFTILKNNSTQGHISFDNSRHYPDFYNNTPKNISTADFNGDGKPEVFGTWNRGVYLYQNNSTADSLIFGQAERLTADNGGGTTFNCSAADMDGDGKKDLILSTNYGQLPKLTVFKNTSIDNTVSFKAPDDYIFGNNQNDNRLALGDMDNDNKPDAVVLQIGTNTDITIMRNTSANTISFATPIHIPLSEFPNNLALGDVNGDGKTDIIISYSDIVSCTVFLNTTFGSNISFAPGLYLGREATPYSYDVVVADFDKDGKPDIATVNYHQVTAPFSFKPAIAVYRNDFCNNNTSSICKNEAASFTAAATGSTYQWQQHDGSGFANINNSSIYSGTNSNKLTLTNPPTNWYGYRYRCLVNGIPADTFTIKFRASWVGAISNAWENPLNWGCGDVPDGNTDVEIPVGEVQVNANAECRSLNTNFGVSVNVVSSANLVVTH